MIFHLRDDLYQHPVVIATRPHATTRAVQSYLRKHFPTQKSAMAGITAYRLGRCEGITTRFTDGKLTIVFLRAAPVCPHSIGVLVHELVHVAADVFSHTGVAFSPENDEAVAYYTEFLVRGALLHFVQQQLTGDAHE